MEGSVIGIVKNGLSPFVLIREPVEHDPLIKEEQPCGLASAGKRGAAVFCHPRQIESFFRYESRVGRVIGKILFMHPVKRKRLFDIMPFSGRFPAIVLDRKQQLVLIP